MQRPRAARYLQSSRGWRSVSRQCKPWEDITQKLAEEVHAAAATTFNKMLVQICDENTRFRLMKGLIQPSLHSLRKGLKDKLDELLQPHLSIHPITYDNYLTETVQQIQGERHDRAFDDMCQKICGFTPNKSTVENLTNMSLRKLLQTLKDGTRPNVEEYSVSLAADVAAAYYKVSPIHTLKNHHTKSNNRWLSKNLPTMSA
jgi:hypothetical protein